MSRSSMPSKTMLISYYSGDRVFYEGEFHDGGEAWMGENGVEHYLFMSDKTAACMACGFYKDVQRCHILPLCDGGDNSLKNIHLLCRNCHAESEFLSGEAYWDWMRYVNTNKYTCWPMRVLEAIEEKTGKPSTNENVAEYWRQKLRRGEVLV